MSWQIKHIAHNAEFIAKRSTFSSSYITTIYSTEFTTVCETLWSAIAFTQSPTFYQTISNAFNATVETTDISPNLSTQLYAYITTKPATNISSYYAAIA